MKRTIALVLVVVLCLSLAACGGGGSTEPGKELIGTWKDEKGNTLTFTDNGKGTVPGTAGTTTQVTWRYDSAAKVYVVEQMTQMYSLTLTNNNGTYTMVYNGSTYTRQ